MIHMSLRFLLSDLSNGILIVRLTSKSYKSYIFGVWWSAYKLGKKCKQKLLFFQIVTISGLYQGIFWFQKCRKFLFRMYLNNVTPTERTRREFQREGSACRKPREARVMLIHGWERRLREAEQIWCDGVWGCSKDDMYWGPALWSSGVVWSLTPKLFLEEQFSE